VVRGKLAGIVVLGLLLAGCGGAIDDSSHPPRPRAWSKERFERLMRQRAETATRSRTARPSTDSIRVGALFFNDPKGDHYCTAGVVDSPHDNLLVTAAHCLYGNGAYDRDIVFVPGYHDGETPYGVWQTRTLIVDDRWIKSGDPDMDVGFVVLQSAKNGKNIEQILGANRLGFDEGFDHVVRVTGYPNNEDQPITCLARTFQQSAFQLRFACNGYFGGTSGSPWVTRFDTHKRTGEIIGVIGGFEQGGNTDAISYSPYFDDDVRRLYEKAVTQS